MNMEQKKQWDFEEVFVIMKSPNLQNMFLNFECRVSMYYKTLVLL